MVTAKECYCPVFNPFHLHRCLLHGFLDFLHRLMQLFLFLQLLCLFLLQSLRFLRNQYLTQNNQNYAKHCNRYCSDNRRKEIGFGDKGSHEKNNACNKRCRQQQNAGSQQRLSDRNGLLRLAGLHGHRFKIGNFCLKLGLFLLEL